MQKYYIGVDWGKSKCGIALADEENKIATGYKTVLSSGFLSEIYELDKAYGIKKIIIGSLRWGKNIKVVEKFREEIEKKGFFVELENEDFSSAMAQSNLKEAGMKNISNIDDAEAARIILQDWLDRGIRKC